ncbi:hypothetical protein AXG93_523s1210 [Marchantia polymorpha subsp. ruderalis]|uniref:Uncharacterized protein n=1 Tax=Marchantia polymorpha subsp. ruderalis TaxID=1480154 RepID=A0A176VYP7_MARPO|nr:hypothetical protein AXG93_523s1210 [Marchantia polymorpha subsp. ruderalis]
MMMPKQLSLAECPEHKRSWMKVPIVAAILWPRNIKHYFLLSRPRFRKLSRTSDLVCAEWPLPAEFANDNVRLPNMTRGCDANSDYVGEEQEQNGRDDLPVLQFRSVDLTWIWPWRHCEEVPASQDRLIPQYVSTRVDLTGLIEGERAVWDLVVVSGTVEEEEEEEDGAWEGASSKDYYRSAPVCVRQRANRGREGGLGSGGRIWDCRGGGGGGGWGMGRG